MFQLSGFYYTSWKTRPEGSGASTRDPDIILPPFIPPFKGPDFRGACEVLGRRAFALRFNI